MALSFSVLLITDDTLHTYILSNFDFLDPRIIFSVLFILIGIALSIYHIFSQRPKSKFEKSFMLMFAVIANGAAGMIGGAYLYEQSSGYLQIFPFLNIISGFTLFVLWRFEYLNESHVSDRDSSRAEIYISLISVFVLLILLHRVYQLHWAIIFSMCVFYATSINSLVINVVCIITHNKALNQTGADNAPPG